MIELIIDGIIFYVEYETIKTLFGAVKPDEINVTDKGDRVVKTYTYRRFKLPYGFDELMIKLSRGITPPLRNPRKIKILNKEKLDEGRFTEYIKVNVEIPKR